MEKSTDLRGYTKEDLLLELQNREQKTENKITVSPQPTPLYQSNIFEDYSGLPEELLKELNIKKNDKFSNQIRDLLQGGPLDINQLLIGLYKKYGRIEKRHALSIKLSNMKKCKHIYNIPGKKGIYSLSSGE